MLITGKIKNICLSYRLKEEEVARLCVKGRNLAPQEVEYGHFKKGEEKIYAKGNKQYRHTGWFDISEEGKFLVMGGDAYNRAIWQFMLESGEILTDVPSEKKYRMVSGKLTNVTFPKVAIPAGAVRARVYYAKDGDEETLPLGSRLQIEYGLIPTFYEAQYKKDILLPALGKGEEIIYSASGWYVRKSAEEAEKGKNVKEKKKMENMPRLEASAGNKIGRAHV